MGLAEAHYNRRGKALRLAHGNYSAPCEAFYHAGTGEAVNCNESFVRIRSEWSNVNKKNGQLCPLTNIFICGTAEYLLGFMRRISVLEF